MEKLTELLSVVQKGLDNKIIIDTNQKEVLDNYVVAYMAIASNELLDQQKYLEELDSLYEQLFEVV